ncbi:MAG TPA: monovalent cation/H+ antiporter subunit D [Gammaproteobacteria bacterium]|nr:monovalent cation/H+ antiporter subunit D [Gammaproteobacteria bacterium]
MSGLAEHVLVLPIVVPLAAGAAMLLLTEAQRGLRTALALASILVQLAAAIGLLYLTTGAAPPLWPEGIGVYSIGAWPAPFGIVLVVDHLSALMLVQSAAVALAAVIYALASWDRPGQPFHSLFQFLLMGLNGAFLTGDLFNLFVFFEVLLAASYGLLMRGVGVGRMRTAMHYIAVNLTASLLFLIGVALIYGIAGTLNMADLTLKVETLAPQDRALLDAGTVILGIAFLVKAGSWPLNFWLPGSYSFAIAPVAAAFGLLTKVGVYAVLRVGMLISADPAAAAILQSILFFIGLATLTAGTFGMLGAYGLRRLVSFSIIVSTGLMLAALGLGISAETAPVLFYLVTSILTTAAFFLLAGMADRTREPIGMSSLDTERPEPPAAAPVRRRIAEFLPSYVGFGAREPDPYGTSEEVGRAIPAAMAFLGLMFVCCVLLVTGLPPLPGFIAKFALLSAALGSAEGAGSTTEAWVLAIAVILTGIAGIAATTRIGMRLFWTVTGRRTPRLRMTEAASAAFLVLLCFGLSAAAGPVMNYLDTAARSLHEPGSYIRAVLGSQQAAGLRSGDLTP